MVLNEQTLDAFIGLAARRFYEHGIHLWRVYPAVAKFENVTRIVLRFAMSQRVNNPVDPKSNFLIAWFHLQLGDTRDDFEKRIASALWEMESERDRVGSTICKSPMEGVSAAWSLLFHEEKTQDLHDASGHVG